MTMVASRGHWIAAVKGEPAYYKVLFFGPAEAGGRPMNLGPNSRVSDCRSLLEGLMCGDAELLRTKTLHIGS